MPSPAVGNSWRRVGSLTSIDPAIQPMSIPPSSTTAGKRVSRASTSLLPATITGMLIATPRATSAMCPLPAAATASTLSSDMITSATVMVTAVRHRLPELATSLSSSSLLTSLMPIHIRSSAPTIFSHGSDRRYRAIASSRMRARMAPTVPMTIALVRFCGGSLRQAMAITTALSPPSSKSMATICSIITAMSHC